MTDRSLSVDKLKRLHLSISLPLLITFLIAAYTGGVEGHKTYVGWHDARYALRSAALTMAQLEPLKDQIKQTQKTADETAGKVDDLAQQVNSLQISSAITAVSALQQELDRHERTPENTASWRSERDRIKRNLEAAVEYRDCLMGAARNCELLRRW